MVRRLKMDVLKDLPPKRRQLIEITPNSTKHLKALEAEKKIRDKFDTVLEEVKKASLSAAKAALDKAVAQAHQTKEELSEEAENKFRSAVKRLNQARFAAFEELARIRHMTALAKVDDVIAFATEALESTDKIVIFAHHHDVMDALMDAFAGKAVCVRGGMSANERQKSVDRFQHDPSIKVFVGGMYAAGVGLTLTAASTVIFAELDWVPGIIAQAEDRCHRIGQTDCVVIYHIVLQDSLDYKLAHTIVTKLEVIEQALDKQDGIEGPRLTRPEDFLTATA
jgi:SWI/SNF-related matrix-associated actin-dependent regulator 1 of chromatin subfamily A